MTERAARVGLDAFGLDVEAWHRGNWPTSDDPVGTVLGVTKVAEEAGELVGALTKYVEAHRTKGTPEAILAELGDVFIAGAGALRRVNDLLGTDYTLGDVVAARWDVVRERVYLHDEPTAPAKLLRLLVFVGREHDAHEMAVHALDRIHRNATNAIPPGLATRLDSLRLVVDGQEVRGVPVSTMEDAHLLAGAILDPRDVYFHDPSPGADVVDYVRARIRWPRPQEAAQ